MARRDSAKRSTHWEGANITQQQVDSSIHGNEIVTEAMVADFGPATLVRIRGQVEGGWASTPTILTTNLVTTIRCAIRKVSLARTDSAYTTPSGNLYDEEYLAGEDILWMGVLHLIAPGFATETDPSPDTLRTITRSTGVLTFDVKAMRRFDSAEERLVFESQIGLGQVTSIQSLVRGAARMLFKAG